jgi:TonB family protein
MLKSTVACLILWLGVPIALQPSVQLPRDRAPVEPDVSVAAAEAAVAARPHDVQPRIDLSKLLEDAGLIAEAEATLLDALRALGPSVVLLQALAGLHNRTGDFEKVMHYLEEAAALEPSNPHGHHLIATYYQEKAAKDFRLTDEQKRAYIEAGLAAEDRAIALDPDFIDALVYKNILLRMRSNLEASPAERERLIAEADALRNRAMQLQKMRARTATSPPAVSPPVATSPRPGIMPQASSAAPEDAVAADMYAGAVRIQPIRGGGNTPRRIAHVPPIYPPDAAALRVRGVVIVEARIEPEGRVSQVRVVRSAPMLDQAALDAVRQWVFEPPMVDGRNVPIIMTLSVPFMHPPPP